MLHLTAAKDVPSNAQVAPVGQQTGVDQPPQSSTGKVDAEIEDLRTAKAAPFDLELEVFLPQADDQRPYPKQQSGTPIQLEIEEQQHQEDQSTKEQRVADDVGQLGADDNVEGAAHQRDGLGEIFIRDQNPESETR